MSEFAMKYLAFVIMLLIGVECSVMNTKDKDALQSVISFVALIVYVVIYIIKKGVIVWHLFS
jgi:hypothetical protein